MVDFASDENFKKAEELRQQFDEVNNNYIRQGTGFTEINSDGSITAYIVQNGEQIVDEEATDYLNNVTSYDVNGNLVSPSSPEAKAVIDAQVLRKMQLDANKAATAIQGTNTVITADAKVTDEEVWSASQNLRISIEAENDAKNNFDKNNIGMTTVLVNHVKDNTIIDTNTNTALNSLNSVYPEPTKADKNILAKYPTQEEAEAKLSGDDLAAWKSANSTVTKYNSNKEFVDTTKNYYSQVNSGNPAALVNSQKTIDAVDAKLAEGNLTDAERADLEAIKASVQSTDTNINENSDVAQRKDAWTDSKDVMLAIGEERADREAEIRELQTKDGYEEAKNRQDEATQETLNNVRDIQDADAERPLDDLNANAQAGRNKFIINNLTSTDRGKVPFYLQLPTMKSITDFHLRNGFSPYGNISPTDVARDALHFNIFEGALGKTKVETIAGTNLNIRVLESLTEQTIGSFTVYPNQPDWFNLSHNHIYSDENPLAAWVNPVLQFVNTGGNILKAVNVVGGKLDVNERGASKVSRRLDFIDQYNSTDKLQISIPFMLFTKGDFLQDIFSPLMFLTALSYPTRLATDDLAKDVRQTAEIVSDVAGEGRLADLAKTGGELASESVGALDKLSQDYGNIGAFRYIVTRRPEYLSVRHASGLFYFKLASIISFSYNFRGPWINSRGDVLSETGGFVPGSEFSINQITREKMPVAFPSIAECNLVVKSVEPMFREDWLGMLKATNDPSGQSLVRVSEQLTGTLGPDGRPLEPINLEKSITNSNVSSAARSQNSPRTGGS